MTGAEARAVRRCAESTPHRSANRATKYPLILLCALSIMVISQWAEAGSSRSFQEQFTKSIYYMTQNQWKAQQANGLGEPKFMVNGLVYPFPWGRPQNDGPALRILSLGRILSLAVTEKWPEMASLQSMMYAAELPTVK